jgi:hypothetical protein
MKSAIVRKVYPSGCMVTFSSETQDPLLLLRSLPCSNALPYGGNGMTFYLENEKASRLSSELKQKGFQVYNPAED